MVSEDISKEYFDWMYHLVCDDKYNRHLSHRKLLYFLNSVEFVPIVSMDENRMVDGIDFRYRFGFENGYSRDYIKRYLDTKHCTVLEMMVAMAFKVEETITDNRNYGNRTGQWFWGMIVSLGLGGMTDSNFDERYCEDVIKRFIDRQYQPNGEGGLFILTEHKADLRRIDIWCQFMWYLNEHLKGENYA